MPYHINKEMRVTSRESYPSLDGLKRTNSLLDSIEIAGTLYNFWVHLDQRPHAQVTTEAYDKNTGEKRQLAVVSLRFEEKKKLPVENQLQVDLVYSHPGYQNRFLAGMLYILLVERGYTIVSDYTQYTGGKELWRRIAKEANAVNCAVKIWNDETNDWIKNESGPIIYDAHNLDDDQIWKDMSAYGEEKTTLMVLQKK